MISASSNFISDASELAQRPVHLIEIDGYSYVFTNVRTGVAGQKPWISSMDEHSTSVNDLEGGADLGEFSFAIQDRGSAITSSFPSFVFEGKAVTIRTGTRNIDQSDFIIIFTGVIETVSSVDKNTAYKFTCIDNKQVLDKVIFKTADDGFPTSNEHFVELNGHPLDILLSSLEDEVEMDMSTVDVAKIEEYRDGIFNGTQFRFRIDSPPTAKEFLEQQILRPMGGYFWTNNLGKLSVNFLYPTTKTPDMTLDEDIILETPEAGQADLVNQMSFRFDKSTDDGKFYAEAVEEYEDSITRYGLFGQQVLESDGLKSGLQGFFLAAIVSRLIFFRYGLKSLTFDLDCRWPACRLELGDLTAVTHAGVPDRVAGVMGIEAKKFIVLGKKMNARGRTVQLTLIDATYLDSFSFYKIAPDAKLAYASEDAGDRATYMFLCNDSDQYSNGDPAHQLG